MLHIDSLPGLAGLLAASAIYATVASGQAIIPSAASPSFPSCGLSCSQLLDAQRNCIPPAVAVADQATYNNCFCTSDLLAQLRISPDGTCDAYCPDESDRQLLQSWYRGFCAGQTTSSNSPASALSTITSGVSTVIVIIPPPTSSSSTSAPPIVTGSGTTVGSTSSSNPSWYARLRRTQILLSAI